MMYVPDLGQLMWTIAFWGLAGAIIFYFGIAVPLTVWFAIKARMRNTFHRRRR
jgi:hypothetical protein